MDSEQIFVTLPNEDELLDMKASPMELLWRNVVVLLFLAIYPDKCVVCGLCSYGAGGVMWQKNVDAPTEWEKFKLHCQKFPGWTDTTQYGVYFGWTHVVPKRKQTLWMSMDDPPGRGHIKVEWVREEEEEEEEEDEDEDGGEHVD